MKNQLHEITARELVEGYDDDGEGGAACGRGVHGALPNLTS